MKISRGEKKRIRMIAGAHVIIYSSDPDSDRAFLRDVMKLENVNAGEGWLIFALPPSEVAVHPGDMNNVHELYLICEDVAEFVGEMRLQNVICSEVQDKGWGLLTELTLPGGGKLGVYQPKHPRPGGEIPPVRKKTSVVKKEAGKSSRAGTGKRKRSGAGRK